MILLPGYMPQVHFLAFDYAPTQERVYRVQPVLTSASHQTLHMTRARSIPVPQRQPLAAHRPASGRCEEISPVLRNERQNLQTL